MKVPECPPVNPSSTISVTSISEELVVTNTSGNPWKTNDLSMSNS